MALPVSAATSQTLLVGAAAAVPLPLSLLWPPLPQYGLGLLDLLPLPPPQQLLLLLLPTPRWWQVAGGPRGSIRTASACMYDAYTGGVNMCMYDPYTGGVNMCACMYGRGEYVCLHVREG